MREYGQIQCAFWQSDDALKTTDAGKLLAAYLLTGPHSNGIGCFRCPDGYVMADLGWDSERVSKGFEELSRNGFAYRFDGVVCLPNFLRWNKIANGNVAIARMAEFFALPKGQSKSLAARALLEFCRFLAPEDRTQLETVSETVSKGYANQNPILPREKPDPTQREEHAPAGAPVSKLKARAKKPALFPLPTDFAISDRVKAWAAEKGFTNLAGHLEAFRETASARAYVYADWDSAFMKAVREDWAHLRTQRNGTPAQLPLDGGSPAAQRRLA